MGEPAISTTITAAAATNVPGVVQVAAWQSLRWLRAGFSMRAGGVSTAYGTGELNLGFTDDDQRDLVAANRAAFFGAVAAGAPAMQPVTLRQVHSATIQQVTADHVRLADGDGRGLLTGDALMTALPGRLLAIQTADCVPVLLVDPHRRVVAAFHAGWRGTAAGIVAAGVAEMTRVYGSETNDLLAAIGPCIGPCCYVVGEQVYAQFTSRYADAHTLLTPLDGAAAQWRLDLVEANRRQLLAAGLHADRIEAIGECTACARDEAGHRRYFSHRDERGRTGRMMSAIGIVEEIA